MSGLTIKFVAFVLICSPLLSMGCSGDDEAPNDGTATRDTGSVEDTNGGPTGDVGRDSVTTDDAGSDAADTASTDASLEPPAPLPTFKYLNDDGSGVFVNVTAGKIRKIENSQGLIRTLTDAEIDELIANYLTEQTRKKMVDGWDCGDATEADGLTWTFVGRALVDPDARDYDRVTVNVSGCIPDDSNEPDAERVHEIIDHLNELRANHYDGF